LFPAGFSPRQQAEGHTNEQWRPRRNNFLMAYHHNPTNSETSHVKFLEMLALFKITNIPATGSNAETIEMV